MIIRTALVAAGLLTSLAFGQEQQTIRTTIVTYGLGAPVEGFKGFYKAGDEILEFSAASHGLSVPVRYEGPVRFILRATKADFAPVEGQQPKPPLAFVDLPPKSDNVLIIAAPLAEAGKFRLVAYDVSTGDLKPGDYRVFNFSNSTLQMSLQNQKFVLPPAKDLMVRDAAWHVEALALPVKIFIPNGATSKLVYESFIEHFPDRRNLMLMFDGRKKNESITFMNLTVDPPVRLPANAPAPTPSQ